MSKSMIRPRRRWRKALIGLGALLVVLIVLVAAAPTLVSLGLGQGAICGALERRVNGTVSCDRFGLGWLGPQSASGLTVTGTDGRTTARLDLGVNAGLLGLLTGRVGALEVDVSGALSGEVRRDGSTSFEDLLVRSRPGVDASGRPATKAEAPAPLAGVPPTTVRIDGVSLELKEAGADIAMSFDDLAGALEYEPGGPVRLQLAGTTAGGSAPGSLTIAATGENVFDRRGALTLDGAAVKIDVALERVPVLLSQRSTELTALRATVTSDDLADHLAIVVEADAAIDGAEAGRLAADLILEQPVQPDGTLSLDLGRITGNVTGRGVPTALLQGAFAGTPIDVARDVGPSLDIDARFSIDGGRDVSVTVVGDAVRVDFAGIVDAQSRSIGGRLLKVSAVVSPDLVAEVADLTIDRPARVEIDVESFSIPPWTGEFKSQLAGVAATGVLTFTAPVAVAREASSLVVESLGARFETAALREGLRLDGSAVVDGAEASFDVTASGFVGQDGSIDVSRAEPVGTAALRGVRPATLSRLFPGLKTYVTAGVTAPVDLTVATSGAVSALRADLEVAGSGHELALTAVRAGDLLRVTDARASLALTPALVAALQEGAEAPIALAEPARLEVGLEPFELPQGGSLAEAPVRGRLDAARVVVQGLADLQEPVALQDMTAEFSSRGGEILAITAEGSAGLRRVQPDAPVALVSFGATVRRTADAFEVPQGELRLSEVTVANVEPLLGCAAGALSAWIGESGNAEMAFRADAGAYEATIKADFSPRLRGEFEAAADGDVISVTSGEATVSLSKRALQQRLAPPPTDGPAKPAGVKVMADLPLALHVRSLRLPRAPLSGRSFDPATADLELLLTGGPLVLMDPQLGGSSIEDLRIALSCDDLSEGLTLEIGGDVKAQGGETGALKVRGRLTGLVTDGVMTPDTAELAMTATAHRIHSAVVDAVAGWQGLLVAAVGPSMNLDAEARRFSRTTGNLQVRVDTPNGWLEGRAVGRENTLRIHGTKPLEAELQITPPFRERLLSRIHPLLADIRTTEGPLQATLGGAVIPLDGDVSRLRGDVELTIGLVEFDSGSVTLALLTLFNASNAETIPGEIEPIKARLRKGIVTYERFAVKIGEYTLVYSGQVDLNKRTVDLRTEIPLAGLAHTFRELEGYADKIVVPLVTRGRLGALKKEDTQIDPDFDVAKAAAEAGIGGLLEDVSKETGIPIGDILDDIFKQKKD
ncbi:MAG: AsmA family protein [Planctomycetota bacterium]|jgi:hypothetical protein